MEDAEDATAAMAQAMGFSSFGTQNPNKRRKFNAHADAVVASTSASTSVVREAKSGSNTIPLGVRVRNEDEINLDSDGEEAGASNSEVRNHPGDNGDDGNPEQHNSDASYPRFWGHNLHRLALEEDIIAAATINKGEDEESRDGNGGRTTMIHVGTSIRGSDSNGPGV
ncbi:hypothetical protein AAE478_006160 [Parahypoxylon ruwenzoriense]